MLRASCLPRVALPLAAHRSRLTSAALAGRPCGVARNTQHTVRASRNTQHATHCAEEASACSTLCPLASCIPMKRCKEPQLKARTLIQSLFSTSRLRPGPRSRAFALSLYMWTLDTLTALLWFCDPILKLKKGVSNGSRY